MNKAISEAKIRSVVRQELRSFLIGEGLWSTGLDVLKTAAGFNSEKQAPDPSNPSALQAFKQGAARIKAGKVTQADLNAFVGRSSAPPAAPAAPPSQEFKQLDGMFKAIKIDTAPFSRQYSELTRKERDSFVYAGADLTKQIRDIDTLLDVIEDGEEIQKQKLKSEGVIGKKRNLLQITENEEKTTQQMLAKAKDAMEAKRQEINGAKSKEDLLKIIDKLDEKSVGIIKSQFANIVKKAYAQGPKWFRKDENYLQITSGGGLRDKINYLISQAQPSTTGNKNIVPTIENLSQELKKINYRVEKETEDLLIASKKENATTNQIATYLASFVVQKCINNLVNPMIEATKGLTEEHIITATKILEKIKKDFGLIKSASPKTVQTTPTNTTTTTAPPPAAAPAPPPAAA